VKNENTEWCVRELIRVRCVRKLSESVSGV